MSHTAPISTEGFEEGGIHTYDSFGRAFIDAALRQTEVRQAAAAFAEADTAETHRTIETSVTVRVTFTAPDSAGPRREPAVCCVCTTYTNGITICRGRCCTL
jgi:hypothetical protein